MTKQGWEREQAGETPRWDANAPSKYVYSYIGGLSSYRSSDTPLWVLRLLLATVAVLLSVMSYYVLLGMGYSQDRAMGSAGTMAGIFVLRALSERFGY